MNALDHILSKYHLDRRAKPLPLSIPDRRIGGLTVLLAELGCRTGAEIGVMKGKFSAHLCAANPGLRLYCVDPWLAYPDIPDQSLLDRYYQEALARLAQYDCVFVRKFSLDAVDDFEPESLDFVYIDGNHTFEYVVNDVIAWSKVVRSGGIVAGHDYRWLPRRCPSHVVEAVSAYAYAYGIRPWFRWRADKSPSWMWVKP